MRPAIITLHINNFCYHSGRHFRGKSGRQERHKEKMKKIYAVLWIIPFLLILARNGGCAMKERLVDPQYLMNPAALNCRLSYGGVNSSTSNSALQDLRGWSLEFEYEKMNASNLFSGVVGLGYLSLDNSSSLVTSYLKGPFLKAGINFIPFASPLMGVRLGPDIRFIQAGVTDKNSVAQSYLGIGLGVNLSVHIPIKPNWFAGTGIREGILNYGNEELKTRYFFLILQRLF